METETTTTEAGSATTDTGSTGTSSEPQIVVPVEIREMTRIETDKGKIHVIHEITLGDLLVSTSLIAILIFMVLSRVIGGRKHV